MPRYIYFHISLTDLSQKSDRYPTYANLTPLPLVAKIATVKHFKLDEPAE